MRLKKAIQLKGVFVGAVVSGLVYAVAELSMVSSCQINRCLHNEAILRACSLNLKR